MKYFNFQKLNVAVDKFVNTNEKPKKLNNKAIKTKSLDTSRINS